MFRRLLIANRGEIAMRVIRTCRKLGIETVIATSQADRDSLPARTADRHICIGPPPAGESYLRAEAMVMAARATECEAVHPGYGFLAESVEFARMCADEGLIFVGPDVAILTEFGDKVRSRALAESAQVPLLPGTGILETVDQALNQAEELGYPILLKPSRGGGGKGMRVIVNPEDMSRSFGTAAAESLAAFGSSALYAERWIEKARHVEVQIAGDGSGAAIHLGDRDCTIQRRQQKLIEESPAPFLRSDFQESIRRTASALASLVRYNSIGTVEFLVDPAREEFFFLEVNPRIQVEHGVTELVTGVDLVELQLRLASGEPALPAQESVSIQGAALQCRINAESPEQGFMPSPGRVTRWQVPAGPNIRVDTYLGEGEMVPPFYDSLVAKIMTHSADREGAIDEMRSALEDLHVEGIHTTKDLARWIIARPEFASMAVYTRWLDQFIGEFVNESEAGRSSAASQ